MIYWTSHRTVIGTVLNKTIRGNVVGRWGLLDRLLRADYVFVRNRRNTSYRRGKFANLQKERMLRGLITR